MHPFKVAAFTALAMLAFAGNSLLCRQALAHTSIDAATLTTVRLLSGALTLCLLVRLRGSSTSGRGQWLSGLALFIYAAGFSLAYRTLPAATGALLLFGSVQATIIGVALKRGERLGRWQWFGVLVALAGLAVLLSPDLTTPVSTTGSVAMVGAGIAWGVYTLRGQGAGDPIRVTAGNFLRALPWALLLSLAWWDEAAIHPLGLLYAVASGAIASGLGYALWYTVLPSLRAMRAAHVQLSVPAIAALGGVVWLGEPLTLRMVLACVTILGGMALVIRGRTRAG